MGEQDTAGVDAFGSDRAGTSADASAPVHDLRNQLSIVLGYVHLCIEADAAGERPARAHLEGIKRATTVAAEMLRNPGLGDST